MDKYNNFNVLMTKCVGGGASLVLDVANAFSLLHITEPNFRYYLDSCKL